jgi:hypothetical protein
LAVLSVFRCCTRRAILAPLCLLITFAAAQAAEQSFPNILCRPELERARRAELAEKLRAITGWAELSFDENGMLRTGAAQPAGGSPTARALLADAAKGPNLMVLEDASRRADVAFCRVVAGRWKRAGNGQPPVFVVLIDFADFAHVLGDADALAAFNVGWGVLHEIDHVVHDSVDPAAGGTTTGACEDAINLMRRECGLAERVTYYYDWLPGSARTAFKTRYVRLGFEHRLTGDRRKRSWLLWDATQIGGLPEAAQLASVR